MTRLLGLFLFLFPLTLTSQEILVYGKVIDGKIIRHLPGAIIYIQELQKSFSTDTAGFFEIALPLGKYTFEARYYGYKTLIQQIEVDSTEFSKKKKEVNFFLFEKSYLANEMVVTADRWQNKTPSHFNIDPSQVKHFPTVAEYDIFRTFTLLPGINQPNNLKSNFYVRGGSSDQNQLLLDGIEIYNPSHLLGLFSSFNYYTIQSANVYTANFPMEYAHRLSSVVAMESKAPKETEEFHGNVGVFSMSGFYSRKFNQFGFVVAGRFTYLDLINSLIYRINLPYKFYDGFTKLTYDIDKDFTVTLLGFFSQDFNNPFAGTSYEKYYSGANTWGNRMGGIIVQKRDSLFTHKMTGSFINNFKEFQGNSLINTSQSGFINLQIYDINVRYDGSYNIHSLSPYLDSLVRFKKLLIQFGGEFKYLQTNYQWNSQSLTNVSEYFYDGFPYLYSNTNQMYLLSGYVGASIQFFENWTAQISLRYSYSVARYGAFIPRASIVWQPIEELKISTSVQYSSQFIAEGQEGNQISIGSPTFILDRPLEATIVTLGGSWKTIFDITVSVEGYYKYYSRMNELQLVRPFLNDPYPLFREGTGYAYGFDVFIDKLSNEGFFFQLAYSYQKAFVTLDRIDLYGVDQIWKTYLNVTYPSRWTIEHALKGTVGFRHAETGWIASVGTTFNYGRPTTPQIASYLTDRSLESALVNNTNANNASTIATIRTISGDINSISLPYYLTIDVSVKKEFMTPVNKWTVYVQIINILNQNGTTYYDWTKYYTSGNGQFQQLIQAARYGLPIYPSLGVECEF